MGKASFLVSSFAGGEWSQTAQGALTDPRYKTAMNVSLNTLPVEVGASTRRPGTQFCGTTRGGAAGRLIPFDFKEDSPYNMEFTDGYLRFWNGSSLVMSNDAQAVVSISTANPAKVATTTAHGWTSGFSLAFNTLGVNNPVLQNRVFIGTVTSPTEFTLTDAITGATIDGSTLGTFVSGNVTRVLELTTIYSSSGWLPLRSVQAETQTVLMNGVKQPQILAVATAPQPNLFATFTLNPFNFIDGPYLDPIAGSFMTPSALNGIVTMTLSSQAYDATRAYNLGEFVQSVGINYRSLQGNNQAHTPASSPTYWVAVNAGAAVGTNGFVASDIGRLLRFLSEPLLYDSASAYAAKAVVSYPSSVDGVNLYYTATAAIAIGIAPGASLSWSLTPNAAVWTWGRIASVSGTGTITPVSAIGTMTNGGGVAGAFNGSNNQVWGSSAAYTTTLTTAPAFDPNVRYSAGNQAYYLGNVYTCITSYSFWSPGVVYNTSNVVTYLGALYAATANISNVTPFVGSAYWNYLGPTLPTVASVFSLVASAPSPTYDVYVGQHYSVAKAIDSVTVFPTTDYGFSDSGTAITLTLRAKATAPGSVTDGTVLGSTVVSNNTASVSIQSSDTTTTWNYVWVELVTTYQQPLGSGATSFTTHMGISQVLFYSPNVNNGSVISVQIEGTPLLYLTAIRTWRLGVYSDTTGWPTCGVYHEGRLWLAGAVGNRLDASMSGDIFAFSPTSALGAVSDDNGITYTFDASDVNTIFWLTQEQQGIGCGTQAGEWLVQASVLNNPLTPTNIQAHRVTKIGCANIPPVRTEHTLLFVQKHGRKVMEYFPDVYSGKFSAPNMTEKAKHLTSPGLAELAYQQELAPVMWARLDNGALIGMTYKRESLVSAQGPTFNGWHRHTLGSLRTLESICVGPTSDGTLDSLSMITNDATNIRHVELLTNLFEEGSLLVNAWFLDDAVTPSSYTTATVAGGASGMTFNGLWHLNGKTVTVFAGGLDVGDWVVSNGSVGVPFAPSTGQANALFTSAFVSAYSGTMPVVIGFTYTTDGQCVTPDTNPESGARNGPGFGKIKRIHKFAASLVNCQGISFGSDFGRMRPALFKTPGGSAALPASTLFSGIYKDTFEDVSENFNTMLSWRVTRPFPATIAGLGGFIETVDE